MKKGRKNGVIVLVIILVIAALTAAVGIFSKAPSKADFMRQKDGYMRFVLEKKRREGYIAALHINGVIQKENSDYSQTWLLGTIASLKNDPKNRGIAVFIDSPGGSVYEADEAYLALQDYRTTGRPIYVYQGSLAASGGYYISCAGNRIFANRNTLTGSIGVITGSSYELTGLFEKIGIKSETIHSGRNKNMFNINEPVSDEQRRIMQSIADECYAQFTGIVAMSRNIPIVELKKIADGRIYTAKQALECGLIDAIDSWEGMIAAMKNDCFEGRDIQTIDFKYERNMTFRDYILGGFFGGELSTAKKIIAETSLQYPAYLYR